MEKFVCIHGHFYQPPRENPWLESIELQDSAAPWHDWNERIAAECYTPNAAARIVNNEGKIENIVSNYSKISFNFGPTLLAWMKDKLPAAHEAIVEADKASRELHSGHGSALAQGYNHMILPLANQRDKYTQIHWGIRDFEFRFGRKPEGMWLPETAADTETLDALAEQGIQFTILSPFQAASMRKIGDKEWQDINGGRIDSGQPYKINLSSGRAITVFFYDFDIAKAVAFERLLGSGEGFAGKILGAFEGAKGDRLVNIATDGESYGHHHRFGEMALAYALEQIEKNNLARLTNYAEFLETHPPQREAKIHEKSAWSCPHGVGRWMSDCGCNSGGHGDWRQQWRAPLREALDWLRDEVTPLFESHAKTLLRDPWQARNEYISVVLDRHPENREKFFAANACKELSTTEKTVVLKLMELQRHAMLMYTSCGWFFDELSGIETVQVIQYAARVLQLALQLFDKDLEEPFLSRLEKAKSNIPEYGDGRNIFQKFVKPARIYWAEAVAHFAISSIFHQYGEATRVFSFTFDDKQRQLVSSGKTKVAIGTVQVVSEITSETRTMSYAVLYMGEHSLVAGVRQFDSPAEQESAAGEIVAAFQGGDMPETIRLIDKHFENSAYSLKSLFKDEQRRILTEILASAREDLENRFRLIADRYAPLMKFLQSAQAPLPLGLQVAWDLTLRGDIRQQLANGHTDPERLKTLLEEANTRAEKVLDAEISHVARTRMERLIGQIAADPCQTATVIELKQIAALLVPSPLNVNVADVQNAYWRIKQSALGELRKKKTEGDETAASCLKELMSLGETLGFAPTALEA